MSSRTVRGVVFDMDGTLLDSMPVVLQCYRRAILDAGGPELTHDEILASFAIGPATVMLETLIGRPVGTDAVARYQSHLAREVANVGVYEGVSETLASLSAALPLGVFTAADTAAAEMLLAATGLRGSLGPVVGADRVAHPKPSPDGLLAVCRRLGLPPTDVAYVGDGPADMKLARACGSLAVAAGWGHQHHPDRDADVICRTPADLLELVGLPRSAGGLAR